MPDPDIGQDSRPAPSPSATLPQPFTHLAFYAGWPAASTAIGIARKVFAETASD